MEKLIGNFVERGLNIVLHTAPLKHQEKKDSPASTLKAKPEVTTFNLNFWMLLV